MSVRKQQLKKNPSKRWNSIAVALCVVVPGLIFGSQTVFADGTNIIEPTSAVLADGSKFVGAGVGLSLAQPGNISVFIPAGASVKQVLIYWDGDDRDFAGTAPIIGVTSDTIDVSGNAVEGVFIGGRSFVSGRQQFTFRADITLLELVSPGLNLLAVSGLDFGIDSVETGAGVLVIVDEGTSSTLGIFDGSDSAYIGCTDDFNCQETVKRTFTFPASSSARDAELTMFFTSVAGTVSGGDLRPSTVRVWVGAAPPIEIINELNSVDGEEWDTLNVEFDVPPGVIHVEVQAFSEDSALTGNNPASFKWLAAALSVPDERNGGGQGCTPGYWKQSHHFADWTSPYDPADLFSDHFEDAFPGLSLLEVAGQGGGGLKALGRHTVAALLNAANPDVSYDLSPQDVIDAFNDVYPGSKDDYNGVKDQLEGFNEQGCPLNNSDGSNGGNSPNNSAPGSVTGNTTTPPTASSSNQTSGGGSFGLWEILALLVVGWQALLRTHRRNFRGRYGLPSYDKA